MAISREEFKAFLELKANPVCEACGAQNWALPYEEGGLRVMIPAPSKPVASALLGNFGGPGAAIPALIAICSNCGNIRFHAAAIVNPNDPDVR